VLSRHSRHERQVRGILDDPASRPAEDASNLLNARNVVEFWQLLEPPGGSSRRASPWPDPLLGLPFPSSSSNRQNDAMNTPSALVATIRAVRASSTPAMLGSATSSSNLGTS